MEACKTVIYDLSGAGNSLRIARDLAERIGDTSLVPLAKVAMNEMPALPAERVGFVFPVIMFGMPTLVLRFLKMVPIRKDAYVFAIASNGGMLAGTLGQVDRTLRNRGVRLASAFSVVSHQLAEDHDLREQVLAEIAATVREERELSVPAGSFVERVFMTGVVNGLGRKLIPALDRGFRVNERCNGCGICAKVCPVHNIDLVNERPVWRHRCGAVSGLLALVPGERNGLRQYGKVVAQVSRNDPGGAPQGVGDRVKTLSFMTTSFLSESFMLTHDR